MTCKNDMPDDLEIPAFLRAENRPAPTAQDARLEALEAAMPVVTDEANYERQNGIAGGYATTALQLCRAALKAAKGERKENDAHRTPAP